MKRIALITLILGTALAIAPAAHAVVLSDGSDGSSSRGVVLQPDVLGGDGVAATASKPATMSDAEYRALMLRGEELNALYGNHITDLTPQQFRAAYEAGIARANRAASIGTPQPSSSGGSSFDWSYVGIAVFGAMLLALGSLAVTRRRHALSV